MKQIYFCAAALAVFATPVQADVIPGLFNTGTDASNVALVGGNGLTDAHYLIFSSTSPGFAGNQAVTYFNGAYAAEDADSRWVSLSSSGNPGSNQTVYRLTFDLTGLDATTASISGLWGVDNVGTIILNGASTGITRSAFSSLGSFSISSGFVAGINTLDFSVLDQGAPTALRVDDLAGTAALPGGAVPEPATWAMMIGGFAFAGGALRRRRTSVASFA